MVDSRRTRTHATALGRRNRRERVLAFSKTMVSKSAPMSTPAPHSLLSFVLISRPLITFVSHLPHLFYKRLLWCGMPVIPCVPTALRDMCTVWKTLQRNIAPSLCDSAPLQTEKHTYIETRSRRRLSGSHKRRLVFT